MHSSHAIYGAKCLFKLNIYDTWSRHSAKTLFEIQTDCNTLKYVTEIAYLV